MKKIGICTIYTGFNYGSALQAFASKCIVNDLGYEAEVLKLNGSISKGRDIRLKKLFAMLFRGLIHPKAGKKAASAYKSNYKAEILDETKSLFLDFYKNSICPRLVSYSRLKKESKSNAYCAFICGSDQVWNATALYVDPFYYLAFADSKKRIAFAPSFGKKEIPHYNEKAIKKYLNGFRCISVREESGVHIVNQLCKKEAIQLVDPTLVLEHEKWRELFKDSSVGNKYGNYILAYFLDKPSENALEKIHVLHERFGLKVLFLPYANNTYGWDSVYAGPLEFLSLINSASYVVTDSFHGVAFSLNFNKQFFVYPRNYGAASNQSTRITSLLKKTDLLVRFDNTNNEQENIDFAYANSILDDERKKALDYLRSQISECTKD